MVGAAQSGITSADDLGGVAIEFVQLKGVYHLEWSERKFW